MKPSSALTVTLLLAALAGCDKPAPRGEAREGAKARKDHVAAPAPPPPGWAIPLLGKGLRSVLTEDGACVGNTDGVELYYEGAPPGTRIVGWGWDKDLKARVQRVVLVDRDFQIVGAGEGGLPRPDVPTALPDISDGETGWAVVTTQTTGYFDAYGVVKNGQGVCKLGHIEF